MAWLRGKSKEESRGQPGAASCYLPLPRHRGPLSRAHRAKYIVVMKGTESRGSKQGSSDTKNRRCLTLTTKQAVPDHNSRRCLTHTTAGDA